ncbi:MAG: sensor histidine kinase [Acidimicrobiales bacterium]
MAIPAAGLAAALALALVVGATAGQAVELTGVAGGGALVAGLAGAITFTWWRRWPARAQLALIAIVTAAATGAGTVAAAWAMLLTPHAVVELVVILLAAATVGLFVASGLGRGLGMELSHVAAFADRLEGARALSGPPPGVITPELAALSARLGEAADRLAAARGAEQALEASRRELVAWISHDLRTPLARLQAVTEALQDGLADTPQAVQRYHHLLRAEVVRLSAMVDDLFELSQIHAGLRSCPRELASFDDLASDAIAACAVVAGHKGVALTSELVQSPQVRVRTADTLRVLDNLLTNAIRHTPSGGTVRIQVGAEDGHGVVRVVDSCGGIPEADLGRVFDLAFRGDSSRSEPGGGLGLAVAKGLAEAQAGYLAVENLDGGCEFRLSFPLAGP